MDNIINRDSGIPFYLQLKQILMERIRNGEFKDGRVSSENVLAEEYDLAVNTVRRALSELKHEDLIYKKRGLGTFIAKPKLEIDITKYLSFGRVMKERGIEEKIKVTRKEIIDFNEEIYSGFEIEGPDKEVVHIERVRYIEEEPIILEKLYYSKKKTEPILNRASNGRLYDYFLNELNIKFERIDEYIEPIVLRADEAKMLETKAGFPALLVTKISYDYDTNWIEFTKTIIRGDRCRSHTRIK